MASHMIKMSGIDFLEVSIEIIKSKKSNSNYVIQGYNANYGNMSH